jgi:NTP pyrophosphatase (non-canonical NTP hydrolase)
MELPAFQQRVAGLAADARLEASVPARVLDLASEVGEVAKEVLKGTRYGAAPFSATEGWVEELGDVFFSLVCLANDSGVDLEKALDQVLAKCRERLARTGTVESGR